MNLYAASLEHFNRGSFHEARDMLAYLLSVLPASDPEVRAELESLLGLCHLHLGQYEAALPLLRHNLCNHRDPHRVEMAVRAFEQLRTSGLADYLREAQQHCHSELLHHYAEALEHGPQHLERERAALRLQTGELEEIRAKLARSDLVCHPYSSLRSLGRCQIQLVCLGVAEAEALTAFEEAAAFFSRELGPAAPTLLLHRPVSLSAEGQAQQFDAMNAVGWARRTVGRIGAGRRVLVYRRADGQAFSNGVARHTGRLSLIEVGHHVPHRALVSAHELGHVLLDLPDIQEPSREDPFSLMGPAWDAPLSVTSLGLVYKAACLTPRVVQRSIGRALRARKNDDDRQACLHFRQAWRQDRWHLALGLQFLTSLMHRRRRREAEEVAAEVRKRFPSLENRLHIATLLNEESLPEEPQKLSPDDNAVVARWHLSHGRSRAALPYLRALPQDQRESASVWAARGLVQLDLWRLEPARRLFVRALEKAPLHYKLRELHGIALCLLGRVGEARREFSLARELHGRRQEWLQQFHLAWALRQWPRLHRSIQAILKDNPDSSYFLARAGLVEWRLGHLAEWRIHLDKACRREPILLHRAYRAWSSGCGSAFELAVRATKIAKQRPWALELLAVLDPPGPWAAQLSRRLPTYSTILWDPQREGAELLSKTPP